MLRPVYNLVLKGLAQVVEIIRVACDPYNQVCIFLRMFLRVTESVGAANVKLDVMAVHPKVSPYQRH